MENKLLSIAFKKMKEKNYDAYLLYLTNENLYEFTMPYDNYIVELTGFSGDTGVLLLFKNTAYLLVDGRFTIQAKREKNDKRIKVVEIDYTSNEFDFVNKILKSNQRICVNSKKISIKKFFKLETAVKDKKAKLVCDEKFLEKEFIDIKKNCFRLTSSPLFLLGKEYVSKNTKNKIDEIFDNGDEYYITSSLEEIAYITNLRYRFCDINDHGVLFYAFMILSKRHSVLYTNDYLEEDAYKYISNSNIEIKKYSCFYDDLKKIKNKKKVLLDGKINNYYIFKTLGLKKNELIVSPLIITMSIKGKKEILNIRKANIIDGVAVTKTIYNIKKNLLKDEFEVAAMVDELRKKIGRNKFLCRSFETIVAYKENSAICHYVPRKGKCKKLKYDSLLLIDSGGHYLYGTTDVTRTISLYKSKIPNEVKKNYTIVLNSMFKLAVQRFLYGTTGSELDIVARQNMYNEYLDFAHGTGHGIGYISNVHDGPNRIGPGIAPNYMYNVLEIGQLLSDEPGLYFENKYGIRIENDLLVAKDKENKYGEFLKFDIMTLAPFDMDLIDEKYLDYDVKKCLNDYNKKVYNVISKHLNAEEKKWLKTMTKSI